MADILTMEEIDALIKESNELDGLVYKNMSAEDFAICIIQGGHEHITDHIKKNSKSPDPEEIWKYYHNVADDLSCYINERTDKDKILSIVNNYLSSYKVSKLLNI